MQEGWPRGSCMQRGNLEAKPASGCAKSRELASAKEQGGRRPGGDWQRPEVLAPRWEFQGVSRPRLSQGSAELKFIKTQLPGLAGSLETSEHRAGLQPVHSTVLVPSAPFCCHTTATQNTRGSDGRRIRGTLWANSATSWSLLIISK